MEKIKNRKSGMVAAEIVVAAVIFLLFFVSAVFADRNFDKKYKELVARSNATNIAVEKMEEVLAKDYTSINGEQTKTIKKDRIEYTVKVDVDRYSDEVPNKKDLVKTVIVNVSYNFLGKEKSFEIKSLATRM